MRHWLTVRTLNQKMALVALALGAIAVFAAPYPGRAVTLETEELALVVGTTADQVEPSALASWIIEGRAGYRVIDVRGEADFEQYHIPTAINLPTAALAGAGLDRPEQLILYSDDGVHAAQSWMLLKARGYRAVYVLKGGLDGWKSQVMFPVVSDTPTPEQRLRDERARLVSAYFGGQPRQASVVAAGTSAVTMPAVQTLPKVAAPSSPTGGPKGGPKKREGC